MTGKYLISTDNWFVAPDGSTYQAAFGECVVLTDEVLGIKTNMRSTNWYVRVGSEENHIIIAGCQIHYAVKCESINTGPAKTWTEEGGKVTCLETPSRIYCPI